MRRLMPSKNLLAPHQPDTTGRNLRVFPNDGLSLLALAVMLAPALDDAEEFGMRDQKWHECVTLAALYCPTVMIEGAKYHLYGDPLQGFTQGLCDLLADGQQQEA
jgi:hypothetical protein